MKEFIRKLKIAWRRLTEDEPAVKVGPVVIKKLDSLKDGKWHNFTITFEVKKDEELGEVSSLNIYDKIIKP